MVGTKLTCNQFVPFVTITWAHLAASTLAFFCFFKPRIVSLCLDYSAPTACLKDTAIFLNKSMYFICLLLFFPLNLIPRWNAHECKVNISGLQIQKQLVATTVSSMWCVWKEFVQGLTPYGLSCFLASCFRLCEVQKCDSVDWVRSPC